MGKLRILNLGFRRSGTWGIMSSSRLNFNEHRRSSCSNTKSWFLHTTNRPTTQHQLSPRQGMHTHKPYFLFYPNFFHSVSNCQSINLFSLSTIRAKSLESQTRMSRKSGTSRCVISHRSYLDKFYFWLGFLLRVSDFW